jgi:hypothetical protein
VGPPGPIAQLMVYDSNDVLVGPVIGFGGGIIGTRGQSPMSSENVGPYALVKSDGFKLPWIVLPDRLTLQEPLPVYFDGPGCTGNAFIANADRRSQPKPLGYPYPGPGNTVFVEVPDSSNRAFSFLTSFLNGACIVNDGVETGVPALLLSLELDDFAPPFRIE